MFTVCRYVGTDGVYTHTVTYERDSSCPMCSAGVPMEVSATATLAEVLLSSSLCECDAMSAASPPAAAVVLLCMITALQLSASCCGVDAA